jgi:hypothetical protein
MQAAAEHEFLVSAGERDARLHFERDVAHVEQFREDYVLGRQERPYHLSPMSRISDGL